jgi:diguanylate cyclase (GGDEF)-like protein/PAS domain S-box-containing protein
MPHFRDPEIYRDILDGLQLGVSVLDLNKKIVFWSDGAEQITGYARLEVLGHSCSENILLHCNHNSCETCVEKCPMAIALHDAKPMEAVSSIHHRLGHWIPVHTWAIPLRDEHGSIIGVIQTFDNEFAMKGPAPRDRSIKDHGGMDHATELPSHAATQSYLREMLSGFCELQIPFGVVCVEIHELSQFRARYGQEAAISILRVIARILRNTIWPTDFVGRWEENRFLVVLTGCDLEALKIVSERILRMASRAAIEWWGEELSVTVSLGSAVAVANDTLNTLLQRAQDALKENKSAAAIGVAAGVTPSSIR